jgi:hypothetical protein
VLFRRLGRWNLLERKKIPGADDLVAGADTAAADDPGVWFATGQTVV